MTGSGIKRLKDNETVKKTSRISKKVKGSKYDKNNQKSPEKASSRPKKAASGTKKENVNKTADKPKSKQSDDKDSMSKEESQKKRLEIAQHFARELTAEFKKNLKSVVVYGSTAKGKHKETSDIDTFVIIDDTRLEKDIPSEVREKVRGDLQRIASKVDKNITIQAFMFLTEFWESVRSVEPLVMEILRYGIPIYDIGIFMPAKRMLQRGMLPTTKEAVGKRIHVAPQHLKMAEYRIKSSGHYMEQAMASAGQAPLMLIGKVPPGKEQVPKELQFHFVEKNLLDKRYADMAQDIHDFAKELEHCDEKKIIGIGKRVDKHLKMTDEFIKEMDSLIKRLSENKVDEMLMDTYKAFLKANVGALELKGIKPPEHLKQLPKVMAEQFPGLQKEQEDLFERLAKALIVAKKGNSEMIPEKEIYGLKEETKRFIHDLGKELKDLKERGNLKVSREKIKDIEKLRFGKIDKDNVPSKVNKSSSASSPSKDKKKKTNVKKKGSRSKR